MNQQDFYFINHYDENKPLPANENLGQILSESYLHPFNWNYRTTRKSFWASILINIIISFLCSAIIGYGLNSTINLGLKWIDLVVGCVIYIWLILSCLGQTIRRLHDVNYSGYWYWANITGVGAYFILYLTLQPSVQRAVKWNDYLFTDQKPYGAYRAELDKKNKNVPTVPQILKEHFFDCFKWDARSTRTSFWVGTAITQVFAIIFAIFYYLGGILVSLASFTDLQENENLNKYFPLIIIAIVVVLAIIIWLFLAQLGHTVRRLHDAGFSGWWYWISIIPGIGQILLYFLLFHPTTKNKIRWHGYLTEDE